jgi:hypothetical protein
VEREDVIRLDAEGYPMSLGRRFAPFGAGHNGVPALSQAHMQQGVGAKLFYHPGCSRRVSPFEYGQDPDANGLGAAALVTVAGLLLLHAAVTKLAVTSRAAMLRWRPLKFVFI